MYSLPHYQRPVPEWYICYNWWTYIDMSLSPKIHHYFRVHSCSLLWIRIPKWRIGKDLSANAESAGDTGSVPGSGRSLGGGNGSPIQYSFLGNPKDRRAWRGTVHRVTKSNKTEQLSTHAQFLNTSHDTDTKFESVDLEDRKAEV